MCKYQSYSHVETVLTVFARVGRVVEKSHDDDDADDVILTMITMMATSCDYTVRNTIDIGQLLPGTALEHAVPTVYYFSINPLVQIPWSRALPPCEPRLNTTPSDTKYTELSTVFVTVSRVSSSNFSS